jgi:hypothetical protein
MARAQREFRFTSSAKLHRVFCIKHSQFCPNSSTPWQISIKLVGLPDRLLLREESIMDVTEDPTSTETQIPSCNHFFDFPGIVNQVIRGVLQKACTMVKTPAPLPTRTPVHRPIINLTSSPPGHQSSQPLQTYLVSYTWHSLALLPSFATDTTRIRRAKPLSSTPSRFA